MAPRRFVWRMALFAVLFVIFIGTLIGLVAAWVAHWAGPTGGPWWAAEPGPPGGGFFLPVPILFLVLFAAVVGSIATGRALRRVAEPLADVMAAMARVAGGEQGVRVQPRGPRPVAEMATAFDRMAERLEGAERQRRALLADVTHELRTPLTVIQAELEALLDGVHQRDDARIGALLDETRVLSRLVDDLRTLSVADAGALELHREPTEIYGLVSDVVESFRDRASEAGVAIEYPRPSDPVTLEIDPVRIRQVLSNLFDNALRHTPAGGSVTARVQRLDGTIAIEVRDTGSGIPPDVLPRVFERFAKGSGSRGSGLGLAIARGLVRAHGGEIEATSEGSGQGSTLRFTLPAA